jgi:hypothetical protein
VSLSSKCLEALAKSSFATISFREDATLHLFSFTFNFCSTIRADAASPYGQNKMALSVLTPTSNTLATTNDPDGCNHLSKGSLPSMDFGFKFQSGHDLMYYVCFFNSSFLYY